VRPTCSGTLDTLDELISCVDTMAHEAICIQFASGWACPTGSPSGAFLD
jgi:hypothetical protein